MGSKLKKALRQTFKQILVLVAIVATVALILVAAAPGMLAAVGVSVGAGFVGAVTAIGATVASVALSAHALIGFGISTYMSYAGEKQAADAVSKIRKEKEKAYAEGEAHFLAMENDRYADYEGPAIGITWPREEEKRMEQELLGDTDKSSTRNYRPYVALSLLAGAYIYGISS